MTTPLKLTSLSEIAEKWLELFFFTRKYPTYFPKLALICYYYLTCV